MDLQDEIYALETADRDIEMAKKRIARQKTIVKEFEDDGHDPDAARALLATMVETLSTFEAHRVLILDRIDKMKRGAI